MLFKLYIILLNYPSQTETVTAKIASKKATCRSGKKQSALCWLWFSVFTLQDGAKLLAFPKMTGRNLSLAWILQCRIECIMGLKSAMKMAERPPLKPKSVLPILNVPSKFTKMELRGRWFQKTAAYLFGRNEFFLLSLSSCQTLLVWFGRVKNSRVKTHRFWKTAL